MFSAIVLKLLYNVALKARHGGITYMCSFFGKTTIRYAFRKTEKHCFMKIICRHEMFSAITKIYLYNFDPFKPHFYIVKLGFTGVYIIFLISAQKHKLWVLVRTALSRRF